MVSVAYSVAYLDTSNFTFCCSPTDSTIWLGFYETTTITAKFIHDAFNEFNWFRRFEKKYQDFVKKISLLIGKWVFKVQERFPLLQRKRRKRRYFIHSLE